MKFRAPSTRISGCEGDRRRRCPRRGTRRWRVASIIALSSPLAFSSASGQADYLNTRAGRPLVTEDAYALHSGALDLYLAPVAASLSGSRATSWLVTPGLSLGILPRTEAGLEFPLSIQREGPERRAGFTGIVLSALHGFTAETERLPALALRASTTIPVGTFENRWRTAVRGIATRTMGRLRANLNVEYTYGDDGSSAQAATASAFTQGNRWLAGAGIDRGDAYRTFLVGVESYARQPLDGSRRTLFTGRVAVRKQLGPALLFESGLGRQLNGADAAWTISAGVSRTLSVSGLIPGLGRWGN